MIRKTDEAHDRFTRLCETMINALEAHPEYSDDLRVIALISTDEEGGALHFGYEDEGELFNDLLSHVSMLAKAHDVPLTFMPVQGNGN